MFIMDYDLSSVSQQTEALKYGAFEFFIHVGDSLNASELVFIYLFSKYL